MLCWFSGDVNSFCSPLDCYFRAFLLHFVRSELHCARSACIGTGLRNWKVNKFGERKRIQILVCFSNHKHKVCVFRPLCSSAARQSSTSECYLVIGIQRKNAGLQEEVIACTPPVCLAACMCVFNFAL